MKLPPPTRSLGRLRPVMRGSWRLGPDKAPALHALVNRIAERVGAPAPDVIAVNLDLNAGASVVGLRRTRVLMLGVPLLLALNGQQLAALIGHELGHFYHQHTLRALLVQLARTVFGALSAVVRPPRESVVDQGVGGIFALVYLLYQLVAGLVSWLLFLVHLTMNILGARDDRRAEMHADRMSAQAAGSTATLEMIDMLAMLPLLVPHINGHVDAGRAATSWRGRLARVREQNQEQIGVLRQLSIRDTSSLFASHPAPGRRHQRLSGLPHTDPAVVVSPTEAERIEAELAPYAESFRNRLVDAHGLE